MTPYEEGFSAGKRHDCPTPPPTRTMKESFPLFGGGLRESEESTQRTIDWQEWMKGWRDGLEDACMVKAALDG